MTDTAPPRPVRLVGLVLVAVGLVEALDLVATLVLTSEGHFDTGLLVLPAGALLLQGRTGWVRPALRVVQAVVVVTAALSVAALLGGLSVPVTVFGGGVADLAPGSRARGRPRRRARGASGVGVRPRRPARRAPPGGGGLARPGADAVGGGQPLL